MARESVIVPALSVTKSLFGLLRIKSGGVALQSTLLALNAEHQAHPLGKTSVTVIRLLVTVSQVAT